MPPIEESNQRVPLTSVASASDVLPDRDSEPITKGSLSADIAVREYRHPEKRKNQKQFSGRKPEWLKVRYNNSENYRKTRAIIRDEQLHTVCEEASCPNMSECWSKGHATMLIMGDICTRGCAFCNIATGKPDPLDSFEPYKVANAVQRLGLKHVVITSVDRDDVTDGGAAHFARVVELLRENCPQTTIEVLTPDFKGKVGAIATMAAFPPDVFNHNLETVPGLYPHIRPGARYYTSLRLLEQAKAAMPGIFTKSGLMVGLGEKKPEISQVMDDMLVAGVDFITIGQYLQPTLRHARVEKYYSPDEFATLAKLAWGKGFKMVACSPLTRSSYHAGDDFARLQAQRRAEINLA